MGIWHNGVTAGGPALLAVTVQQSSGTKVDVTGDVLHPSADLTIQQAGRQTETSATESGYLELVLDDTSGRYTPGRAASSVSLSLGTPLVVRETVGRKTFDLFSGQLNQPEVTLENLPSGAGDRVSVTAVDWLGQQTQGRTFLSNLGEWVRDAGGSTLVEYWPMTETAMPLSPIVSPSTTDVIRDDLVTTVVDSASAISAGSTEMPIGEDGRIATIAGALNGSGTPAFPYHLGVRYASQYAAASPQITSAQVITVVAWVAPSLFVPGAVQELLKVTTFEGAPAFGTQTFTLASNGTTGTLSLTDSGGVLTGTVTAGDWPLVEVFPIAIRYGISPSVFEAWVDQRQYVGTLTGGPPSSLSIYQITSGAGFQGGVGHLQIYKGAAANYTFTNFLAQIDYVRNPRTGGSRFQRTDERLRMLARYAGLSSARLDFGRGVAYMDTAALGGTTFIDQASKAVATEQGRLITSGNGNLRFDNRLATHYDL